MWLAVGPFVSPANDETVERRLVRFRTVGDANCTGAVDSPAVTLRPSSMRSRAPTSRNAAPRAPTTSFSETAMEDRKREGYF
jgi:sulfate adenylyltransferase subunit 2